jgi:hypothetical protein
MRKYHNALNAIGGALLVVLMSFTGCSPARPGIWNTQADIPQPKSYVCIHADGPVRIDGRMDEPEWRSATWTDDFVDIEGDRKPTPRFRTRVKMLWNDEYFIIGAEISEPHIWATLTKRDTVIFYDNDFEVFIDPNGDNHEYYEFEMNALNTVWDLFLPKPYRDQGSPVDRWNIEGLKTAVSIHGLLNDSRDIDTGWTAEIAMPWKSLAVHAHTPAPPVEGDQWRVNFSRVEWTTELKHGRYLKVQGRPEDNWVWSPQWVVDMHWPELWGYVQFTRKPAGIAPFVPDGSWNARVALLRIYHAQIEFFKQNQRWAGTKQELGEQSFIPVSGVTAPVIRLTDSGYVCSVNLYRAGARDEKWNISQDSRIWRTE